MKTAEQRKRDFLKDLAELMKIHGAEMQLTDDGKPYGMHSPLVIVSFSAEYSTDGETLAEFGEFELDSLYL